MPKFDLGEPPQVDLGTGEEGPAIPETCADALAGESTVGCLFFAVDMDSHDLVETAQYGVAVANVQLSGDATVVVEQKDGAVWSTVAGPQTIPSLSLFMFPLADRHADDSLIRVGGAYRVTSDVPVVAYQFNPVDGASSYLSDASMLYPVPSLDTLNQVSSVIATIDNTNTTVRSYATVVGTQDNTTVTVIPSVATVAGAGVQAGSPGVPFDVTLQEGDVLNLAVAATGTNITGTKFSSTQPVAVFAGHECALLPNPTCCCDHTEEQIAGLRLWGTDFVAARMPVRDLNTPEGSMWQILASEDDTQVTLTADPVVTGLPASPFVLHKGQMVEFTATGPVGEEGDFFVSASKPVNVFGYMIGAENMPPPYQATGDPAMVQMAPVAQFLPRYVVLVPSTWINDVAVVTRPAGATISIDGIAIADAEFAAVVASGFEVARVPIPDGVHVLDGGGDAFSVVIVGYDQHDSYAYLGGTGTGVINPNPPPG
jgi:hypothetical protein